MKYGAFLGVELRGSVTDENASGFGVIAQVLKLPWGNLTFGDGNGTGNVNKLYSKKLTIAAGSSTTLNLLDGSLFGNVIGESLVYGNVKVLAVQNLHATDNLEIGNAAADPWDTWLASAGSIALAEANGLLLAVKKAGWTVDATHKNLKIHNPGANSIDFEIAIFGSAS